MATTTLMRFGFASHWSLRWMDHPLVLLGSPWVSKGQRKALPFADFVARPQGQRLVLAQATGRLT